MNDIVLYTFNERHFRKLRLSTRSGTESLTAPLAAELHCDARLSAISPAGTAHLSPAAAGTVRLRGTEFPPQRPSMDAIHGRSV
jgi:hypothetical protein